MTKQPEALRLAELLCKENHECCDFQAAAELRRLHGENKELLVALKLARRICNNLIGHPDDEYGKLIDAAIKKAEGI
jgi:hypothetical protein